MKGLLNRWHRRPSGLWESFPIGCNVMLVATDAKTGKVLEVSFAHNLVVTTGKVLVARMLMEDAGFDTGITFCEVGTGTNAPALSDTALQTSTKRNAITSTLRTSNVVQFRTFYAAADITANLKEIGLFGHSTASATQGTGELFNRAAISFDNTAGSKDLTVVVQITFG